MPSSIVPRLSFGLVVSTTPREIVARVNELAAWLRASAKIELVAQPAPTYKTLAASVRKGESDIAWLPPVVYAWLAEAVTPIGSIARGGRTTYASSLIVRNESPLRSVAELAELRAGWVDPWSAAGYVVPRLELARAGIAYHSAFRSESFYGSHRDAILALGRDECDVVGTYARAQSEASEEGWAELEGVRVRELTTFGAIPADVIAARRNLAPREYEAALRAFRTACADEIARPLVRAVFGGDELREGTEAGHETLRRDYERAIANGLFD